MLMDVVDGCLQLVDFGCGKGVVWVCEFCQCVFGKFICVDDQVMCQFVLCGIWKNVCCVQICKVFLMCCIFVGIGSGDCWIVQMIGYCQIVLLLFFGIGVVDDICVGFVDLDVDVIVRGCNYLYCVKISFCSC